MEIKARLRKWEDKDLERCILSLKLKQGQMSILVRESVRKVLVERGVMETVDDMKVFERRDID
ncbi:MAG: hypothetical protein P4L49_16520 [Desulfosporosinus sp.]|nr:hypothetical protein [Desulfosporosinus sp.]